MAEDPDHLVEVVVVVQEAVADTKEKYISDIKIKTW
jgi:hypothetical protein